MLEFGPVVLLNLTGQNVTLMQLETIYLTQLGNIFRP